MWVRLLPTRTRGAPPVVTEARVPSETAPESTTVSIRRRPLEMLQQAVQTTPVPSTPTVQLRSVEERGLALLELGTHFEHVIRRSENLTLVDRQHLQRTITLDVDLSRLTPQHLQALSHASSHHQIEGPDDPHAGQNLAAAGTHVWMPLSSQTRRDLAGIVVRDNRDEVLPRMPSDDISDAYAAALIKLFRMLLDSSPETTKSDPLYRLRHETQRSRWLIEAAIKRLVFDGVDGSDRHRLIAEEAEHTTEAAQIRAGARGALDALIRTQPGSFNAYLQLLSRTALDFPLIVLLRQSDASIYVHFQAPPVPGRPKTYRRLGGRMGARLAQALSPVRIYQAAYDTSAPRSTSAYHLTLEVAPQLRVRRFMATTNVDVPMVETLVDDMEAVAARYDQLKTAGSKILENELQSIAERLCDVSASRQREAEGLRGYLRRLGRDIDPEHRPAGRDAGPLLDDFVRAENRPLRHVAALSSGLHGGRFTKLVDVLTAARLRSLSERCRELELGRSVLVNNDPRDHGGHVYWHQSKERRKERVLDPVEVEAHTVLVDDPPSLAGSVRRMLFALAVVVAIAFTAMFESVRWVNPWSSLHEPVSQADALVTTLLLVPGLLLTRLDIPETRSVIGQVRYHARLLAVAGVGLMALLATYMATTDEARPWVPSLVLLALLVLIAIDAVGDFWTRGDSKETAGRNEVVPEWVRREFPEHLSSRLRPPMVRFRSLGRISSGD